MSDMYGFGAEEMGQEQAPSSAEGPKFYREWMDKVSGRLDDLKAENDRLREGQRQQQVAEALKAKGITPVAAQLFTGTPDKLDDWLGTYGAALAKTEGALEGEPEGQQAGPPPTVVSPESQAAMAAIAAAGAGGAGPQSGDDQLAARLEAAGDDEAAFNAIMREHGNPRFR